MKPYWYKLFFGVLLTLLLCGAVGQQGAYAQDASEDPFKKPQLWKKLKSNPNDSTLWSLYFGKKWSALNKSELENIGIWKQELYIQSIAEKEAITGSRDKEEDLFKETPNKTADSKRPVKTEAEMKQLAALEAIIMQERSEMAQLKKNIYENFVILEDMLHEEFAQFNVTYRYYDDAHPDRKYSEIRWIEEQEARLKKLKQEKVNQLRRQAGIK